jgi:hypothetical protein
MNVEINEEQRILIENALKNNSIIVTDEVEKLDKRKDEYLKYAERVSEVALLFAIPSE